MRHIERGDKIIVLLFSFLWSICTYAQPITNDIEEVYQKPMNASSWGSLYSWLYQRDEFNKSYAIVIGVGDYGNGWNPLESPSHDAMRVRDYLINKANFDYVVTLTNAKATKDTITKFMEEVFPEKIKNKDRFLFYFSGHGTQRKIRENMFGYLVLKGSGLEEYGKMISMDDIERWDKLSALARHALFVLDCCFSGLAGQQTKSPLEDKQIDRLSQYAHHLITAGTANEESVSSLKNWGGSLFTQAFLTAIERAGDLGSADYKPDGVVSLKELMKYIGDYIDDASVQFQLKYPSNKKIKMSPQISNLQNNEGEFFFITELFQQQQVESRKDHPPLYNDTTNKSPFSQDVVKIPIDSSKCKLRCQAGTFLTSEIQKSFENNMLRDSSWTPYANYDNQYEVLQLHGNVEVIVDNSTGLMWQQSGSLSKLTWQEAQEYVERDLNGTNYGGYSDWRLPTIEELGSIIEAKKSTKDGFTLSVDPRFDYTQRGNWSADKVKDSSFVFCIGFEFGNVATVNPNERFNSARAVRINQ